MNFTGYLYLLIGLAGGLISGVLQASDLQREARLSSEMESNLFDGDALRLSADATEFVNVYIEAEEEKGVVVLLHGRGYHADWELVVGPLRVILAESGWSTLSAQMPVLEKGALYYDYVKIFPKAYSRIEVIIEYLRDGGKGPIVLLAHSCGAHMAMSWIDSVGDSSIDAYIGMGMGATDYHQDLIKPFPLNQMAVPVLDLLGSEEYSRVKAQALVRKKLLQELGHPASTQQWVEGADHYFHGKNEPAGKIIISWLDSLQFQSK